MRKRIMSTEIKVPQLPESVADATIAVWHKKPNDFCNEGELLADLETDKIMLEVPAPVSGILTDIVENEGAQVVSGQLLAKMEVGSSPEKTVQPKEDTVDKVPRPTEEPEDQKAARAVEDQGPAVRRMVHEKEIKISGDQTGSGPGGRLTKDDLEQWAEPVAMESKRVPMSRLRATIAKRLVEAQQNAAILTTFNEVNMKTVMELRKNYKEAFEKKHGVRLGFMSFFVKACSHALSMFPEVNASIEGTDVIYHPAQNIGIAISSPRGLVVPVLNSAEEMSMAEVESSIVDYANKAKTGKLSMDDLQGGTFSITNGGVFGSMLSTPILNPPQSAILGMHNITERVMVEDGEMVIRPMMYLALSYDHRLIDGATSVRFLVELKGFLENPSRMILDV